MSSGLIVNPNDVFPSIVVTYNGTKRVKLQSSVLYRIPVFEEKILQSKNNKIRVEHKAKYEAFLVLMNIITGSNNEVKIANNLFHDFIDLILDWRVAQLYLTAYELCQKKLPEYVSRIEQLIKNEKEEKEIYKEYYQFKENTEYKQIVDFIVKSYKIIQSEAFKFFKKAAKPNSSDLEYAINALSELDAPFFNSLSTVLKERKENLKELNNLHAQIEELKAKKETLEKENAKLKQDLEENGVISITARSFEVLDYDEYSDSDDYNDSETNIENNIVLNKLDKATYSDKTTDPDIENRRNYKKLLKSIMDNKLLKIDKYKIIHFQNRKYVTSWNPLLTAVLQGKVDIVAKLSDSRELVEWADPKHKNNLLHYAAKTNNCEVTSILLNKIPIDEENAAGQTPLHWAALYGSNDVLQLLLKKGAAINLTDDKCRSVFHMAAMQNNPSVIETLFDQDYDDSLLEEDEQGNNPLVIAVQSNSANAVSVLNQYMEEPSKNLLNIALQIQWEYDESIFSEPKSLKDSINQMMESQYETNLNCYVSEMVIELNQMESFDQWINECDRDGNTPIHLAIINRHKDALNLLLKNSDRIKFQPDIENRYPAEIAVTEKLPDYLTMLINCESYPIDKPCADPSLTLLMKAIETESNDCFSILIRCPRADKNDLLKFARKNDAPSSIIEEIESFTTDISMLSSSDNDPPLNPPSASETPIFDRTYQRPQPTPPPQPQYSFPTYQTPQPKQPSPKPKAKPAPVNDNFNYSKPKQADSDRLILAAQKGSDMEIRLYLNHDPHNRSTINDYNNDGRSILHIAALNGRDSIIEYLLTFPDLLVNEKDNLGKWPLYLAIENLKFHTAAILMKSPAIDYTLKDINSQSILHIAGMKGAQELIPEIIKRMDDPNIRDKDGKTALHIAAQRGQIRSVEMMVKCGLSPTEEDNDKRTALHIAAVTKRIDIVRFLIGTGMNLDIRDINGKTAMYLAAENDATEIVKLLIESGANPNIPDKEDKTLVVFAAIRERTVLLEQLLQSPKVDPNIPSKLGRTALHLAAMGGRRSVVNLLLKYAKASKSRKGRNALIPVNPNAVDQDGRTPFFLAVTNRRDEIAIEMAKNPLIDITIKDNLGGMAKEYTRNPAIMQVYYARSQDSNGL